MSEHRATLPRTLRLRGAAQFTGAFQGRYRSKHFLLLTRPGSSLQGGPRLGMVIGRHQVARAVERTRLKRIIREVFRLRQHQLGQIDIVARFRAGPGNDAYAAIRSELNALFEQVEA